MSNKKNAPKTKPANLAFIGKTKDGKELDLSRALTSVNDGMSSYKLPSQKDQALPFYAKHAKKITQLYPLLYKLVTDKTGKPAGADVDDADLENADQNDEKQQDAGDEN